MNNTIDITHADGEVFHLTVSREDELQATADSIDRMFERLYETKWYQWIRYIEIRAILLNQASHLANTVKRWKQ